MSINYRKKKILLCMVSLLIFSISNSQVETKKLEKDVKKDLQREGYEVHKNVLKLGAGLGFKGISKSVHDPTISPIGNLLKLEDVNPVSFVLSTSLIINPIFFYYRAVDENGIQYGDVYSADFPLSFIATLNLAEFGGNRVSSFNKKIDGGLGLGLKLSDDFHVGVTYEMTSIRQLRTYIINEYDGKPIIINDIPITSLDLNDDRFFADKYHGGFSIKFIYVLLGNEKEVPHNPLGDSGK